MSYAASNFPPKTLAAKRRKRSALYVKFALTIFKDGWLT